MTRGPVRLVQRLRVMPLHQRVLVGVAAALVVAIAAFSTTAAVVPAIKAQQQADKIYAQHHPVGITKQMMAKAEAKVKQQAAIADQRREDANAKAEVTPGAQYTPAPQAQVAGNRAMPPGQGDPASGVVSTTRLHADTFAAALAANRSQVTKTVPEPVTLVDDSCLDQWVLDHLHDYDGKSFYGVMTVCGKQVAMIAGAGGIDERILLAGATEPNGPADVKQLLLESTGTNASFASSATKDGRTVLLVASVAE
ncbi:hypothetical protein ACFVU2_18985 [Leifsonia sp. NPDC058194]|uniref:hypothetical protein n=1 Tax=Leifsonia sp. NPDC058194 TaxID=3346374 RepID=UPI0036DEABBE